METNEKNSLQNKLLEMLKWFDSYCRTNNLKYCAIGGTLLGAVRHKGFIPWDDDIDIAMPRSDYNKLAKMMNGKIFEHYILETQETEKKDFCYPYYKLYDINTTLIENYRKPLVRGIFIDIFPIDSLGNDKNESLRRYKRIQRYYRFYLTRVASIRPERSFFKNFAILLSQLIPESVINDVKLRKKINSMCQRYHNTTSKWGGNLLGNWGKKEIVSLELFDSLAEYTFEDMKLLGPEDYNTYLTYIYGNWNELPPVDKQVSHHDYLEINLNKSYLNK